MANLTSIGPQPIGSLASNVSVATNTVAKRSAIDLMPAVNRTETLTKFFNATVDHLFQPEDVEFVSGYIGSKPAYYDQSKDFYVKEADKDRQDYQLPITAISIDPSSGATKNVMFYDDLLNQLSLQGSNVTNPSRLLDGEYYSWSPPIDIDKFVNFNEYYWLPAGPGLILLLDPTDLTTDAIGKDSYTYNGSYTRFADNKTITGILKFTSGMRIRVTHDANRALNGKSLVVERVGRSILIQEDTDFQNPSWDTNGWDHRGWDGGDAIVIPDYMTIERFSPDRNRWSVNNRWFHKDVILASGMVLSEQQSARGIRPIIEFEAGLHLYNFGTRGLPDIDLIDTTRSDIFGSIAGKPSAVIDGTNLIDGMRILATADSDATINNRIYEVSGIEQYGLITLTPTPEPMIGDCVYTIFGRYNANKTFWYDGNSWKVSQSQVKYHSPLFAGYDMDGNNLIDPAIYPGSTFAGHTIFTYATDTNSVVDPVLNIQVKRDQFGDYVFDNSMVTKSYSYIENNQIKDIVGYIWYMNDDLGNGWYKSRAPSKQYIVNSYDIASPTTTFMIDQWPAADVLGELPNLLVYMIRSGASRRLVAGTDYIVEGRIVTLSAPVGTSDRIEIHSWSANNPSSSNGYYQIPLALASNPNNDQPTTVSFNQTLDHFTDIISNQQGETTSGAGDTKWKDSAQVRGLGTKIVQHRSPLLKLMMLNSNDLNLGMLGNNSPTDPSLAIQFAQREYVRFYNRFIRSLFKLYSGMGYSKSTPPQEWINGALAQVNLGKSKASAWAYSGYEQAEDFSTYNTVKSTYIPPTASKLGLAPVYKPEAYLDYDYEPAKLTLQTHDGARIVMEDLEGLMLGTIDQDAIKTSNPALLTHPVAAAWLQLELNLYAAIPAVFKDIDAVPVFDQRIYAPGKWRTGSYSRTEYVNIMRPSFDKWAIQSQVDYVANPTFALNNQFSFNYRRCVDRDGQSVPGHWKGIYRWFYDTDRPHTHPWEMLGFSQQPTWWTAEYGPAPYTRGNLLMWQDLASGIIRRGARAGQHLEWARAGLLSCIPTDDQGDLLSPLQAGTVISLPSASDAQSEWIFGDGAPIESVWLTSLDHGFASALTSYLMKPAMFIEQGWDPLKIAKAGSADTEQHLYINTNRRKSSAEFYMHRENPSTIGGTTSIPNETALTFYGSWGIQHWISEFLISQNLSVTKYMGDIIRGAFGVLGHKFGGFVSTDNSLRVLADSFGQIGYTNQLIPSENLRTYLYRSTSIGVHFYSGVIVIQERNGWKVYGYDGINPVFNIIPSVKTGPRSNVVIGNQNIFDYQTGQGSDQIAYGTVFQSRQEVYDFLVSYGRWLESEGWIFDALNVDSTRVINWRQSAKDFMYWSQGNWSNGNFIALSPLADGAKFKLDFGTIQYVNGTIGGTYPVLDKGGQPIEKQNLEILRQDGEILIKTINSQTVFGLRLFATTVEHIMLLDNVTQFNDLIYDSLYSIYQPRLKMYVYKTNGWNGRLDAPGYFLYQDPNTDQWSMIGNFEKSAEDFRNLYNIDQPKNVTKISGNNGQLVSVSNTNHAVTRNDLSDLAKHLIGYQRRDYLENLLPDETTEFQFYQGFIRQKGTKNSLTSMLRNTDIPSTGGNINYYEEYALRKARYGAVSLNTNIDFILTQSDFINSPQRIDVFSKFYSDQANAGAIDLVPRDPRIVVPPENYEGKLFPLRPAIGNDFHEDLPTAGYVQLGETTWQVLNRDELLALSTDLISQSKMLSDGDTVWQLTTSNLSWDVWKVVMPTASVVSTISSLSTGTPTIIEFNGPHGIVNGDIVICSDFAFNDSLNGTFIAQNVTISSVTVPVNTFINETAGDMKVYRSVRFHSYSDLCCTTILGGWDTDDLVYVDNGLSNNQWTVYRWHNNSWEVARKAEPKVAANLMLQSKLYDKTSRGVKVYMEYFDPAKGIIPGIADREITYKTVFDPAKYNQGDTTVYGLNPDQAWATSHVGEVWWDLSTTRYVDYEQGDTDYRTKNWGKIVSGTTIDIYEWVRSPIPPSDWSGYVLGQTSITQFGMDYLPSGTVRNANSPAWTTTTEYDKNGNKRTWYYFWVSHSDMSPTVPSRSLTTNEITNTVLNPSSNDIPWYAAVGERSLIVANIYRHLSGDDVVMQIVYSDKENDANDHKEWSLIRDGDQYSQIDDQYWAKMRDSFTGSDLMGNQVPDPRLNELQRYGMQVRPRQTWFKDRLSALSIWVAKLNSQLASSTTPLVLDSNKYNWLEWFGQGEQLPQKEGNWDYKANDTSELNLISKTLEDGERVLVPPTAANNNLWTIQTWDAATKQFIVTRIQSYNVQNYWGYQDWYISGYSATTIPTYTISTINDINNIKLKSGETVKILDYASYGWGLIAMIDGTETLVGLQDGTIQISDKLWNSELNLNGWDRLSFDSIPFDYNPATEIGLIFDGVRYGLYDSGSSIELNQLFFSMINYVLSEQTFVDWIFKTSYILVSGVNEPLTTSQLYKPNTVDSLLDYINEAKPYSSKIRDFISARTIGDTASIGSYDFDKPVYEGRVLNVNDAHDANILATDSTFTPWYNHYQADPALIRKLKTQLVFDRTSSMPTSNVTVVSGAAQRILSNYHPTQYMPPIDSPDLISGTDYKGHVYTGTDFNMEPGWGLAPWDFASGWDADESAFDSYLELIMQGGLPPVYDQFYGNGSNKQFKLTKIPQDLLHSAVWRDTVLAVYGVDYKVPNWADRVEIAYPGTGYQVGDVLELIDEDLVEGNKNPVIRVTSITAGGGIKTADVINKGYYDIVKHGSYHVRYDPYHVGPEGVDATIQPVWGGDTLVFVDPPADSYRPNIWVLYSGTTFESAPDATPVTDGNEFVQPEVDADHAEELYTTKIRDAVRLDTYSAPVGGRPLARFKNYVTDGLTDHFDLGIRPHNQSAVLAYLDGLMLQYGPTNDYVINFATGTLVFLRPPAAGKTLSITSFGEGGSGNSVASAYVSKPGKNYKLGSFITLGGGVPAENSDGNHAVVIVQTVTASDLTINNGGNGYKTNDLIMLSPTGSQGTSKLTVRVDKVSSLGAVLSASISSGGNYGVLPSSGYVWLSTGKGSGISMTPSWGVSTVSISNPGLYMTKPTGSFAQLSISTPDPDVIGVGAEFNVIYTSIIGQDIFLADGVTGNYRLTVTPTTYFSMLVTVNGVKVDGPSILINGNEIAIQPPRYGSTVVVTVFNTPQFSTAVDTEITARVNSSDQLITSYNLSRDAHDTLPDYATTIVSVNGVSLPPPTIDTYVSNGYSRTFPLTYQPASLGLLSVYVNGVLQAIDVDYTVHDQLVELNYDAAVDAIVVLIVVDPDYGYYYKLDNTTISFEDLIQYGFDDLGFDDIFGFDINDGINYKGIIYPGDRISVTNFSQDLSYGFATEQFVGKDSGLYELAGIPTDESTLSVVVNGVLQRMLWDYALISQTLEGYDTQGYDLSLFDEGKETRYYIKFNENLHQTEQDTIIVRYTRGKAEKPPVAFRQFINAAKNTQSQVIADSATTSLLSNVYVYSSEIEVADLNKLTPPTITRPGAIWVNDEKIVFGRMISAPTAQHPHRGFLSEITRGSGGTSSSPTTDYQTGFYDGNGVTRNFVIPPGITSNITVWVGSTLAVQGQQYDISGFDVVFKTNNVPSVGYKNIRITAPIPDSTTILMSHQLGSVVQDAGFNVTIQGGYSWEPNPEGLQYSESGMARFILEHPCNRS